MCHKNIFETAVPSPSNTCADNSNMKTVKDDEPNSTKESFHPSTPVNAIRLDAMNTTVIGDIDDLDCTGISIVSSVNSFSMSDTECSE